MASTEIPTRPTTTPHRSFQLARTQTARTTIDLYPCTLTHSEYYDAREKQRFGDEEDSTGQETRSSFDEREHEDAVEEKAKGRKIVTFEDGDPENPKNWSSMYKSWITVQLGLLALAASLGSSIISPAEPTIAAYVGVSNEVTVLCISLYILGFAFGPLAWAPVSEIWGRRVSMIPAMLCLGLFSIGTATSKNAQSVFITRFFAGLFGSAPVSNVSAALGDIW